MAHTFNMPENYLPLWPDSWIFEFESSLSSSYEASFRLFYTPRGGGVHQQNASIIGLKASRDVHNHTDTEETHTEMVV